VSRPEGTASAQGLQLSLYPQTQETCDDYDHEGKRHGDLLRTLAQRGRVTLVFSAHDEAHNDAVVLKDLLLRRRVNR
jgi:uncharacterized protein YeaO (DUF488 family)